MRALGLLALMVVLPIAARAQTDSTATPAEATPPPSDAPASPQPEAAPAAEAPAPPAQAESVPAQAAPQPAPVQQAPAPPSNAFTPQPSPLVAPQYAKPRLYAPPPQQRYAPPPAQLYAPPVTSYAQPTYGQPQYAPPQYAPPAYAQPQYAQPPSPYPAPLSMPPLPSGYIYLPVPYGAGPQQIAQPYAQGPLSTGEAARREELYGRLRTLDSRYDQLRSQRVGVGGAITFMVLGYGTAVVSGIVSLASFGAADDIKHGRTRHGNDLDFNNDGFVNSRDRHDWIHAGRVGAGVAGAGLFVGLLSTARLAHNLALRRAQSAELRSVDAQRRLIRTQLDYGASAAPGQFGLSINGRF